MRYRDVMLSLVPRLFRSFATSVLALALVLAAPSMALARPHPAPTATPVPPPEDPAITTIARREFVSWQAGVVTKSRYAETTQAQLQDQKIATTSKELGMAGSLVRTEWVGPVVYDDAPPGVKGYLYRMICTNAAVYEQLTIGPDGKIVGILFRDKLDK